MTISLLPAGPADDVPYELWEGEEAALAEAAAAGSRAAEWIRSLPGAPSPCPVGSWLAGELPQAIEAATSSLDPGDCDRMGPEGVMVDGNGGVDEGIRSSLAAVPCAVQDARWLTPDQQIRLVAVASLVAGAARLLAEDPGTRIMTGELSRMWALVDHAIA
ncbi:hypothetical protein ASD97_39220 [Streptomyces sp. Root63]|uniref:hypothetical protein n=1 Tax=unclassified Streptomyces TaxID=2593676 RepID=UPI0006F96A46|nr:MULTISPECIES: hypothetical protein [unclassified Streptomyces]KQX44483.1 hypothetical protein ASD29_00200 [Streptomyces sp. Root1295]KRA45837.1 hypothetical protein ASD97_39220 [Streptomyces sp. Root63]